VTVAYRLLRGQDLNLRPSGYEPDELPDCSTARQVAANIVAARRLSRKQKSLDFKAFRPASGSRCSVTTVEARRERAEMVRVPRPGALTARS
jgi:hypothetical protein